MLTIKVNVPPSGDYYFVTFNFATRAELMHAVESLKSYIAICDREYEPVSHTWQIDTDAVDEFNEWLTEMSRSGARIDVRDERHRQRAAPPPPPPHRLADTYRVLHLLPTAPAELIKAAYKTLSMMYHPDRGGSHEQMVALNNAYDKLKGGRS